MIPQFFIQRSCTFRIYTYIHIWSSAFQKVWQVLWVEYVLYCLLRRNDQKSIAGTTVLLKSNVFLVKISASHVNYVSVVTGREAMESHFCLLSFEIISKVNTSDIELLVHQSIRCCALQNGRYRGRDIKQC